MRAIRRSGGKPPFPTSNMPSSLVPIKQLGPTAWFWSELSRPYGPVLIKAIQEQQTTLEQKDADLERLKEEKDAEIKALNNRLTALEELMRQTPNQR